MTRRSNNVNDSGEELKTFEYLDIPDDEPTQSIQMRAATPAQDVRSSIPGELSRTGSFNVKSLEVSQFGKFLQALNFPFLLISPSSECYIEFVSKRWEQICPGTSDMVQEPFASIFTDGDAVKNVRRLVYDVVMTRRPSVFETAIRREDHKIWGRLDFLSVKLAGARYVLVTLQDLTFEHDRFEQQDRERARLEYDMYDRTSELLELEEELRIEKEKLAREQTHRRAIELRLSATKNDLDSARVRASVDMSKALIALCRERDKMTGLHHERVTRLSGLIGERMKLDNETIRGLQLAAAIHDIGKLVWPDAVLKKPRKASEFDWEIIRRHPEIGYAFLKNLMLPANVTESVYQHHEMMDGSGYPKGLDAESIRLEARIIRVADTVEAMLTGRPWRPEKMSKDMVILELAKGCRQHKYDVRAVNACASILREGFVFNV